MEATTTHFPNRVVATSVTFCMACHTDSTEEAKFVLLKLARDFEFTSTCRTSDFSRPSAWVASLPSGPGARSFSKAADCPVRWLRNFQFG
jgi:hypothetical protein